VVEDVDAVEAAVEPGGRQPIWKAFEEHATNGGRLGERRPIWQRVSARLVPKHQVHLA